MSFSSGPDPTIINPASGLFFNTLCHLHLWDYSDLPINLLGQISLIYLPIWLMMVPFTFWFDDLIRFYLYILQYDGKSIAVCKRGSLIEYYKAIFKPSKYPRI